MMSGITGPLEYEQFPLAPYSAGHDTLRRVHDGSPGMGRALAPLPAPHRRGMLLPLVTHRMFLLARAAKLVCPFLLGIVLVIHI